MNIEQQERKARWNTARNDFELASRAVDCEVPESKAWWRARAIKSQIADVLYDAWVARHESGDSWESGDPLWDGRWKKWAGDAAHVKALLAVKKIEAEYGTKDLLTVCRVAEYRHQHALVSAFEDMNAGQLEMLLEVPEN